MKSLCGIHRSHSLQFVPFAILEDPVTIKTNPHLSYSDDSFYRSHFLQQQNFSIQEGPINHPNPLLPLTLNETVFLKISIPISNVTRLFKFSTLNPLSILYPQQHYSHCKMPLLRTPTYSNKEDLFIKTHQHHL